MSKLSLNRLVIAAFILAVLAACGPNLEDARKLGFDSVAQMELYQKAGFKKMQDFEKLGFDSLKQLQVFQKEGFKTMHDFNKLGFNNLDEMKSMQVKGFKTYGDYEIANAKKLGFSDLDEMKKAISLGYKNKEEFEITQKSKEEAAWSERYIKILSDFPAAESLSLVAWDKFNAENARSRLDAIGNILNSKSDGRRLVSHCTAYDAQFWRIGGSTLTCEFGTLVPQLSFVGNRPIKYVGGQYLKILIENIPIEISEELSKSNPLSIINFSGYIKGIDEELYYKRIHLRYESISLSGKKY